MTPLPKRKYAKARRGERRSHIKLALPNLTTCPTCRSPKLPHRICPTCGSYDGRTVLEVKSTKKKGKGE